MFGRVPVYGSSGSVPPSSIAFLRFIVIFGVVFGVLCRRSFNLVGECIQRLPHIVFEVVDGKLRQPGHHLHALLVAEAHEHVLDHLGPVPPDGQLEGRRATGVGEHEVGACGGWHKQSCSVPGRGSATVELLRIGDCAAMVGGEPTAAVTD